MRFTGNDSDDPATISRFKEIQRNTSNPDVARHSGFFYCQHNAVRCNDIRHFMH